VEEPATRPRLAGMRWRAWRESAHHQTLLILGALAALALVVRLPHVRHHVAVDETSTIAFAQRSFGDMWRLLIDYEGNAIPYYLLAYPLYHIGDGITAMRLVSVLAGALTVVALVWVGTSLVGRRAALIGALLLSVNAFAVVYSQTARPYALAMLCTVLSYGVLLRAAQGNRAWWIAYIALTVFAYYLNSLSATLILLAQAFVVLGEGRQVLRRWLFAVVAIFVLIVPLAIVSLRVMGERDVFYWVDRPGIGDLARGQIFVFGGLAPAAICLVLIVGTLFGARRRLPRSIRGLVLHPYAPVAAWAFAPIVVLFLGSQLQPYYTELYLTASVPAACLVVALCLERLPGVIAPLAVAILVVASLGTIVANQPPGHDQDDWDGAFDYMTEVRQPGDPVLFDTALGLQPAGYYDPAFAAPDGRLVVPQWGDAEVPENVALLQNPGSYFGVPNGPPSARQLEELVRPTGRAIVMFTHIVDQGDFLDTAGMAWARSRCDVVDRHFRSIDVAVISGCSEA
jgi:mannosyltransferase